MYYFTSQYDFIYYFINYLFISLEFLYDFYCFISFILNYFNVCKYVYISIVKLTDVINIELVI